MNHKMFDWCQLTLPVGSNNTNHFVYVLLILRSPNVYIIFFYKHSQNKTVRVKLEKKIKHFSKQLASQIISRKMLSQKIHTSLG